MIVALAFCRLLHVGSLMLVFGECAFMAALVPPRFVEKARRRIAQRSALFAVVAAVTGLVWLALASGQMGDGWADALNGQVLGDVLFSTAFGKVWQVHLAIVLGLLILCLATRRGFGLTALLSGLALASLGLIGHAAALRDGLGWTQRTNHALHLLVCGAWLGSLPPLLPLMRALECPGDRSDAALALRRYSQVGHWVVALVVATGSVDTGFLLGRWPSLPFTPYEDVLLAKLMLVAGMIALALVNRYRLVPRLSASPDAALAALRRNTLAETLLGGLVVLASIGLSALDPR